MNRKAQKEGRDGDLFPVRFDIEKSSEEQTKKVQGLFQAHGNNLNLLQVRKKIYERGLRTFEPELKKLDKIKAEV